VDGVERIVDATFAKASVSFQFVDARTGEQLDMDGSRDIEISVTGKNEADVVDNFGGSKFGADYGVMAVAIREGVVPSRTNQVFFTVHAQTTGYLTASKEVVILQEGHQHIVVEMINISDAPTGLSISEDEITAVPSSGVTDSEFTLSPSISSTTGRTATVTIPAGTKLMDKNSSAASGNVTATIAYSNPQEEGFSNLFPGSSDVATMSDDTYASFKTLGLVSMDLNTTSKEIKKFNTPIQMTVEIPSGSTDMDGVAVTAGSTFGIYSYDDATGKWTHEGDETVASNNGKLEVTFDMEHLSTWQVAGSKPTEGTYYYNEYKFTGTCPDYFNNQNDIYTTWTFSNGSSAPASSKGQAITKLNQSVYYASVHKSKVSTYTDMKRVWYKKDNPSMTVEASADYNQPVQTVNFPASWCPVITPIEFTVKLETYCPDSPDRKIRPQCTVFAWEEGGAMTLLGQMTNGELKINTSHFDASKKYTLITFYQNKIVALTGTLAGFDFGYRTFDGTDVDLSRDLTSTECTYLKTK
jgi:hypothetical protein